MAKFKLGQTVYGIYKWRVTSGPIEDSVWEPKERSYSVRTPYYGPKKWWGESELYETREQAQAALDALPDDD